MAVIQRLWDDRDIEGMGETVVILRRMRNAATLHTPSLSMRIHRCLNHLFGGTEEIHTQQTALADAETLAQAAGDFFAAKISKTTHHTDEFQKWQDLLFDANNQYLLYTPMTYAQTSLNEVVGYSLIGRMRNTRIDPSYMLTWDLLKNNNLGTNSIRELLNENIGIISPLSGDYLMACFYSSYLQRTKGKSLSVHAAALSKDLTTLTLPKDAQGNNPFMNKPCIGIYIDTTETGNTAEALFQGLQTIYQGKKIHTPMRETSKATFVPSNKMIRYWKRATPVSP
ncbi:MAG: hypothetical protein Q7R96_00370 [Nanoarchaeota archaeon]|nr:hypothetical protein [Nanoarchaeota archaeon]